MRTLKMQPTVRWLGRVCLFCCCTLWLMHCSLARADDSLTFSPTASTAGDGQSFSFNITLNTTNPVAGFSMYLEASAASSFEVTGESPAGTPFAAADSNFYGTYPVLLTTSSNSPDLGYSQVANHPAGSYLIGSITIMVNPSVPKGTFTITTTTGPSGSEYDEIVGSNVVTFALPQATETITVPEPDHTPVLLALSIVSFLISRPRRTGQLRA